MTDVLVLGVFNADCTFRADRAPNMGETILGRSFHLGPGGKGSNQAVAAARAGASVGMLTRLGQDNFADMAEALWREAGITPLVERVKDASTGAAYIFVEEATGNNAIIICPGAAGKISPAFIDAHADQIAAARVVLTQGEQPLDAAMQLLRLARGAGAVTVFNPAPVAPLPEGMLALCDYVTPNETEAEGLTGIAVRDLDSARAAASALVSQGAGAAIVTLGSQGVLFGDGARHLHVPAMPAGPVLETTGAGDCFNGAFAAALAAGQPVEDALRFGCAAAGLSVSRAGAAASMPTIDEIRAALKSETR